MAFHHAIACKSCNAISRVDRHCADFYNSFESLKLCGHCGTRNGWRDTVVVWVPRWRWFNPLTWGSGEWIE